jgi:putative transposase
MPPYMWGAVAEPRLFIAPRQITGNRTFSPMHERRHLRRLHSIWLKKPVYFLTVCAAGRRPILHQPAVAPLLIQALRDAPRIHGWIVGRFVIMPDHVHFFCTAAAETKGLPAFIRDWKRWTARQIEEVTAIPPPIWQLEFFDHVLRSPKSYSDKWHYVRENPVRAGLVAVADEWPHQGECEALEF